MIRRPPNFTRTYNRFPYTTPFRSQIAEQFEQLKNRQEGTALAQIVSAYPLADDQVQQLVSGLEKKFGLKLKPAVTVDADLIGGVRVIVGDQVLDTSVQADRKSTRLNSSH